MPNISLMSNMVVMPIKSDFKNLSNERLAEANHRQASNGTKLKLSTSQDDMLKANAESILNDLSSYQNGTHLSNDLLYIDDECDELNDGEVSSPLKKNLSKEKIDEKKSNGHSNNNGKPTSNDSKSINECSLFKNRSSFYDNQTWLDDDSSSNMTIRNESQLGGDSCRSSNGDQQPKKSTASFLIYERISCHSSTENLAGNKPDCASAPPPATGVLPENKKAANTTKRNGEMSNGIYHSVQALAATPPNQRKLTYISEKSIQIEQCQKTDMQQQQQQQKTLGKIVEDGERERDDFDDLIDLTQRVPHNNKKLSSQHTKAEYIAFTNVPTSKFSSTNAESKAARTDSSPNGRAKSGKNSTHQLPPLPPASPGHSNSASAAAAALHSSTTRLIIPLKRENSLSGNSSLNSCSLSNMSTPSPPSPLSSMTTVTAMPVTVKGGNTSSNNSNNGTASAVTFQQFNASHRTLGDVLRSGSSDDSGSETQATPKQKASRKNDRQSESQHEKNQQQQHQQQPVSDKNNVSRDPASFTKLSYNVTKQDASKSNVSPSMTPSTNQKFSKPPQTASKIISNIHQSNNNKSNGMNTSNFYHLHNDVIYEEESPRMQQQQHQQENISSSSPSTASCSSSPSSSMQSYSNQPSPKEQSQKQQQKQLLESSQSLKQPKVSNDVSKEWDQITKIFASLETLLNEVVESTHHQTSTQHISKPCSSNGSNGRTSKEQLQQQHQQSNLTSHSESNFVVSSSCNHKLKEKEKACDGNELMNRQIYDNELPVPTTTNGKNRETALDGKKAKQQHQQQQQQEHPDGSSSVVNNWIKNLSCNQATSSFVQPNKMNVKSVKHLEVCEFLKRIGLEKYQFTFISSGYDDIFFLNDVISLQDLLQMGIEDYEDTFRILKEVKHLRSSIKLIIDENVNFTCVSEWLDFLNLNEYRENFTSNHIDTFKRVKQLWEIEFTTILQIPYLGHRQRLIASIEARTKVEEKHRRNEEIEEAQKSMMSKSVHTAFQSTQTDDYLENQNPKRHQSYSGCIKSVKFAEDNSGPGVNKSAGSSCQTPDAATNVPNDSNSTKSTTSSTSSSSSSSHKMPSDFQSSSSLEEEDEGGERDQRHNSSEAAAESQPNMHNKSSRQTDFIMKSLFPPSPSSEYTKSLRYQKTQPQIVQSVGPSSATYVSANRKKSENKSSASASQKPLKLSSSKKISGNSSLKQPSPSDVANESQRSPKAVWKNDPQHLIKNTCNFSVQYLGSSALTKLKSNVDPVKYTIDRLKNTSKTSPHPSPFVELAVSINGVKLLHSKTKELLWNHDIKHINNVCQDQDDLNYFAFSTQTDPSAHYYCHVFACKEKELTTKIILTIGQAFDLAYELFCKNNL